MPKINSPGRLVGLLAAVFVLTALLVFGVLRLRPSSQPQAGPTTTSTSSVASFTTSTGTPPPTPSPTPGPTYLASLTPVSGPTPSGPTTDCDGASNSLIWIAPDNAPYGHDGTHINVVYDIPPGATAFKASLCGHDQYDSMTGHVEVFLDAQPAPVWTPDQTGRPIYTFSGYDVSVELSGNHRLRLEMWTQGLGLMGDFRVVWGGARFIPAS